MKLLGAFLLLSLTACSGFKSAKFQIAPGFQAKGTTSSLAGSWMETSEYQDMVAKPKVCNDLPLSEDGQSLNFVGYMNIQDDGTLEDITGIKPTGELLTYTRGKVRTDGSVAFSPVPNMPTKLTIEKDGTLTKAISYTDSSGKTSTSAEHFVRLTPDQESDLVMMTSACAATKVTKK